MKYSAHRHTHSSLTTLTHTFAHTYAHTACLHTILLLISWKWISHTFSTMSSFSKVTKPKPEGQRNTDCFTFHYGPLFPFSIKLNAIMTSHVQSFQVRGHQGRKGDEGRRRGTKQMIGTQPTFNTHFVLFPILISCTLLSPILLSLKSYYKKINSLHLFNPFQMTEDKGSRDSIKVLRLTWSLPLSPPTPLHVPSPFPPPHLKRL